MDFYYMNISPPCRAVMLTAKALNIELHKKPLDVFKCEHLTDEFLKINPCHIVPTLVDGDFILWESRAICCYLVTKYAKDDALYPKFPDARAKVDRMLYFDIGTLYKTFMQYASPVLLKGEPSFNLEPLSKLHEALAYLESVLSDTHYAACDHITLADHSLIATVTTMAQVGVDLSSYSNIGDWMSRCSSHMIGYQTENADGATEIALLAKRK